MWSFCPILPGTPIDPAGIDKPPASGPYYVAERVPNRLIRLERNPNYHGGRPANPDHIVWTINTDAGERLKATEEDSKRLHTCVQLPGRGRSPPGGQVRREQARRSAASAPHGAHGRFRVRVQSGSGSPRSPGAGQAPLRKAINFALDRRALARARTLT